MLLNRSTKTAAAIAAIAALVFTSGCSGGGGESKKPRVAFTSEVQASYVNTRYGPLNYGKDFGLDVTEKDFQTFDSHATATQTALSGRADIVGGSFISHVLVQQRGQDFKVFCPFVSLDDFVLVGRNGVSSVTDLFDKKTRVAVDSSGGAGAMILDAMLAEANAPGTSTDLPNTSIVESSGLRTSSFASGKVDATVIHVQQYNQAKTQVKDAEVIASLYDDVPIYIKEAFAAPAKWLKENKETAAGFCASVLKGNRELKKSYSTFHKAVQMYVQEPPSAAEEKELYGLIQKYEFWPEDGGLSPKAVKYMTDLGVDSGVLKKKPDNNAIVDRDVLKRAVALANEKR
ncbi:MAG: hypothetical protein GEV10_23585 [Streptosporangiales bacterium]|nr:hypothetical protein [Streptosporangiales bacterium]